MSGRNMPLLPSWEIIEVDCFYKHFATTCFSETIRERGLILEGFVIENLHELPLGGTVSTNEEVRQSWKTTARLVRPLLDSIWNAFGEETCLHYNDQGDWIGAELNKKFTTAVQELFNPRRKLKSPLKCNPERAAV